MKIALSGVIRMTDIPSTLAVEIQGANTFENPALRQALKQKRSTRHIPAKIKTYQWDNVGGNRVLTIPRGYLDELLSICDSREVSDLRCDVPFTIPPMDGITLRDYQVIALGKVLQHEQGILQMPTGGGKTVTGLELIRLQRQKALILVHSAELAKQWQREIKKLIGITPGMIGGGKWKEGDQITIAMLQTLSRNPDKAEQVGRAHGLVLVDEAHHIPAQTFAKVMSNLPCKYRYGLTATPFRSDGLDALIHRVTGDVVAEVTRKQVEDAGGILKARVEVHETGLYPGSGVDDWQKYMAWLMNHADRNELIATVALTAATDHGQVLILTDRINQAMEIHRSIRNELDEYNADTKDAAELTGTEFAPLSPPVLAHGQLPAGELKEAMLKAKTADITIGTTGLLGEGLDMSGWSVLLLASPISGRVRLLQAIGRVIRPAPGKEEGLIVDFVDNHGFSIGSFNKRKDIYEEARYRIHYSQSHTGWAA